MPLSTYNELLTAIQAYNDDDTATVTDKQADFVALAEARIFNGYGDPGGALYSPPIRCRALEASFSIAIPTYIGAGTMAGTASAMAAAVAGTVTPTAGLACTCVSNVVNAAGATFNLDGTVTGPVLKGVGLRPVEEGDIQPGQTVPLYWNGTAWLLMPMAGGVPLPSRFLGARHVICGAERLDFVHPDEIADTYDAYSIEQGALIFGSGIAAGGQAVLKYYRRPLALATQTNDLFAAAPHIYLYASLLESAIYLTDDGGVEKWHSLFVGATEGYLASDRTDAEGATRTFIRSNRVVV